VVGVIAARIYFRARRMALIMRSQSPAIVSRYRNVEHRVPAKAAGERSAQLPDAPGFLNEFALHERDAEL
jgi:hypothetical protein